MEFETELEDERSPEHDGPPPPPQPGDDDHGLPEDAPDELRQAARNEGLGQAGEPSGDKVERGALSYLLGATKAPEYDVDVEFDTPEGLQTLTFHIRSVDGRRITAIENEHTNARTNDLDDIAATAALVAEATEYLLDGSGEKVDPDSAEFRGDTSVPTPVAMEKRFKYQDGLLAGVAGEVRRLGGWTPDRVKTAKRASSGPRRMPGGASPAEAAMERAAGN